VHGLCLGRFVEIRTFSGRRMHLRLTAPRRFVVATRNLRVDDAVRVRQLWDRPAS